MQPAILDFWIIPQFNNHFHCIFKFCDPENLCIDTSLTFLGCVLTILDHFDSFGIMADTHNAPHNVPFSSNLISNIIM